MGAADAPWSAANGLGIRAADLAVSPPSPALAGAEGAPNFRSHPRPALGPRPSLTPARPCSPASNRGGPRMLRHEAARTARQRRRHPGRVAGGAQAEPPIACASESQPVHDAFAFARALPRDVKDLRGADLRGVRQRELANAKVDEARRCPPRSRLAERRASPLHPSGPARAHAYAYTCTRAVAAPRVWSIPPSCAPLRCRRSSAGSWQPRRGTKPCTARRTLRTWRARCLCSARTATNVSSVTGCGIAAAIRCPTCTRRSCAPRRSPTAPVLQSGRRVPLRPRAHRVAGASPRPAARAQGRPSPELMRLTAGARRERLRLAGPRPGPVRGGRSPPGRPGCRFLAATSGQCFGGRRGVPPPQPPRHAQWRRRLAAPFGRVPFGRIWCEPPTCLCTGHNATA